MKPDELETWLNARPEDTRAQESTWIAFRAAARVLPVLLHRFGRLSPDYDLTCLNACRCILISGVAGTWPTPEIRQAAYAAARSADATDAYAAARSAATDAYAAARSAATDAAAFSADVAAATDAALSTDTDLLDQGKGSGRTWPSLWPGETPADLAESWDTARDRLPQPASGAAIAKNGDDPQDDWSFWIDWYDGLLQGDPQNQALLAKIALIDDADWAKGPAHVNAIINGIVAKYAFERSYIGERIDRDANGLFSAFPANDLPVDILANAVAKVTDRTNALRASIASDNNALIAVLPVLDDLDDTVKRHSGNPLRLHDDFREFHLEIDGLLQSGELSPDRLIDRLQRSLQTGALDCEGNSEACRRAVNTRVNTRAMNLTPEQQASLRAVSEAAQAESDADLRRELAEDLETGLDASKSEEKRGTAMKREGSRLIRIKDKRDDSLKALDDTAKAIKSADTVWDFVSNIWQWFI